MELLAFAILIGIDNLIVSAGLGGLGLSRTRRIVLVAAFALAEAILPLIGLLLGSAALRWAWAAEIAGPLCLLIAGVLALLGTRGHRSAAITWPAALLILPVTLGLDNLLAGAGFGALGFGVLGPALVLGGVSAAACWVGLWLGSRATAALPLRAELASGVYLIVLAGIGFILA